MRAARPKSRRFLVAALASEAVFRVIFLSLAVCAATRCRPAAEIQNLPESIGSIKMAVFGHVRSCILIVHRASRAILYDPRDLFLFGYQCGCPLERTDPGRKTKIFQNL